MYTQNNRPRPHVSIPAGARAPTNPSPSARAFSPFSVEVTPPAYEDSPLANPWDSIQNSSYSPDTPRTRTQSMYSSYPGNSNASISFPEPMIYRSTSARASLQPTPTLTHRHSRSDVGHSASAIRLHRDPSSISVASVAASSYYHNDASDSDRDQYAESQDDVADISRELSSVSLVSEEGLSRFQSGSLLEKDEEWHRLVPPEAQEALGKQEVQRQSVIFEVFKSERDYVFDLEAVKDVYIEPLRSANPPIISPNLLPAFINEVFGNLDQILAHHQRMLGALFSRQREQHPLLQSIADIVLDTTLKSDFRSGYETYIKHYPLAESYHRKELKRNPAYQSFVQSVSNDPRIRKRDLITFLSRPVTRLPRLNLLLEQILKLTDVEYEHPDLETLPIILGILKDCIKGTQPGIEAAESKVKFWALCETLVYQKGEIIDMDLYDKSRTLVYSGTVSRRMRSDSGWSGWSELNVALLDNFLLLTREETRSNGVIKRYLMSRPIPLAYLRLGPFNSPAENRKESRKDDGGILSNLRSHNVLLYPFTVYHSSNILNRRYTLYVTSDVLRKKWHSALVDAIGVHKARQEGNMFFEPQTLSERFFRSADANVVPQSGTPLTGAIGCAVPFMSGGRKFIAVGCPTGIYVSPRGEDSFRKVLNYSNPTSIAALETQGNKVFNKFLVHFETSLLSYSLDLVARVALGQAQQKTLNASLEKVAGHNTNVIFFRQAVFNQRTLIIYASKKLLQVTLSLTVLEAMDMDAAALSPRRNGASTARSFRPFGDPGYVPKDAYDMTTLVKTIGICTHDGIVILDPMNLTNSAASLIPDFQEASSNMPMSNLKARIEDAKPLGVIRVDADLLIVYDVLGFYITKHGAPTRSSGYIKWESKATSYAHRGVHVLLFSAQFIEIRNVTTGRLVQVVEAADARLLYCPAAHNVDGTILVAMRGDNDRREGATDKIVELVETSEIGSRAPDPVSANPALWDEWDM